MTRIVDNLIAFRILRMLVTPFNETEAYKLGVIDEKGDALKRISDMSSEQKDNYTMLHRMVFRLKKLLAKVPGGGSRLASFTAAYYLVKENANATKIPTNLEEEFINLVEKIESQQIILIEEQVEINKFLFESVDEDAPANVTGAAVSTDIPVKRKMKTFDVNPELFTRFARGKKKYTKWKEYLNIEDEYERSIYDYARKNPRSVIVLKNSETGAVRGIRFNRNGGGSWKSIQRKTKVMNNVEHS
jgi:hypothetical protein